MIFNPFENRACRDIRNNLAHGLIKAIRSGSMTPFSDIETRFCTDNPQKHMITYILHRKTCLEKLLDQLKTVKTDENKNAAVCVFLWNHRLFFEFHEYIEHLWLKATQDTKKALQALILSAVIYEHLTYNRLAPAKKLADKAIPLFEQQRSHLPQWADPDLFITKLTRLDPVPPVLEMVEPSNERRIQ